MGFLFFGKKRSSEVKEALGHIDTISQNLKNSFSKIKIDMKVIRDWLSYFKTKDKEYENRFKDMESRIDEIGEVITYIHKTTNNLQQTPPKTTSETSKEPPYYQYEKELTPKTPSTHIVEHLTETQKAIFFRLGTFQAETGKEWISIKVLAHDLYPRKSYDKIRSTISEYIGILMDAGLVEKMRKGKQTYIKITPKGQEYFQTSKRPIKKTVPKKK